MGGPSRVADQIDQMSRAGIRNLMLTNRGLMPQDKANHSIRLLAEQVMPRFRDA